MKSKKIRIFILAIFLFIISTVFIIIKGNIYTVKIHARGSTTNVDEYIINIENENIAKCIDKKINNGVLELKIKANSKGHTYVDAFSIKDELHTTFSIYVHTFNIITFNEFLGDCNGSVIIPISIIILSAYILYLLIISFRRSAKENLYQYKNIAYLGMIIFGVYIIIAQFLSISSYKGIIDTINRSMSMFSFVTVLLPITVLVSVLVILSNISLIRKEGFSIKNILGIILGLFLCFSSWLPEIMYKMLFTASWIDIHNQNGIGLYIYNFVENTIFIVITYIECILIGTIIMSIKTARHIPKFDKDFIIILGCKLKKDGTLTNLLKGRVDKAIDFGKMQNFETGKDIIFIPSGGKGQDEVIEEAQAMKNYLIEQGIQEEKILIEDKSQNTYENIKFSNNLIKEKMQDAKVAFSTTNYHVYRAGCIAADQNLNFEGIGAKTKPYFWVNAFIREFIATLHSERKKHILAICSILALVIVMLIITYMNNNIV